MGETGSGSRRAQPPGLARGPARENEGESQGFEQGRAGPTGLVCPGRGRAAGNDLKPVNRTQDDRQASTEGLCLRVKAIYSHRLHCEGQTETRRMKGLT